MMDNVIGDDPIMDLSYLMEDNMRVDSVMDLDLNQEPLDPSSGSGIGLGSLLNELETTNNQIEDRIRQLEGLRARRQRWRQAQIHLPENFGVLSGTMGSSEDTEQNGENGGRGPSTGSRLGVGFLLNDSETAHSRIEDRIRQLEAVNARARQRQRWRQARNHLPETSDALIETIGSTEGTEQNRETVERAKSGKRDSSHLVAKALELDTEVKKVVSEGGGFFDCNVCLDMARDPILTCCGHLFCWACFYQLPYVYSTAKECPVCKGEVTDSNVTPIFGNGDSNFVSESESGVKVPPRPQAHRIESVRQQRVNRAFTSEAVRRIRMRLGATGGDPSQQQEIAPATIDSQIPISELSRNPLLGGGSRRLRSRHLMRVLSDVDASHSSTSSGLDNPRLFEDYAVLRIQEALSGRSRERVLRFERGHPSTSSAAVEEHHHQSLDSAAEINSTATRASSSERADVSSSDGHLENLRPDAPTEMDLTEPSSFTRRRTRLSRVSDIDNGASRAPRRRRLNYIL